LDPHQHQLFNNKNIILPAAFFLIRITITIMIIITTIGTTTPTAIETILLVSEAVSGSHLLLFNKNPDLQVIQILAI